jgi:hypothetical protein
MPCCTNQSSIAQAWKEFGDDGRMKDSSFRERVVVDVAEEFAKHCRNGPCERLFGRPIRRAQRDNQGRTTIDTSRKRKEKTRERAREFYIEGD